MRTYCEPIGHILATKELSRISMAYWLRSPGSFHKSKTELLPSIFIPADPIRTTAFGCCDVALKYFSKLSCAVGSGSISRMTPFVDSLAGPTIVVRKLE